MGAALPPDERTQQEEGAGGDPTLRHICSGGVLLWSGSMDGAATNSLRAALLSPAEEDWILLPLLRSGILVKASIWSPSASPPPHAGAHMSD